MELKEAAPFDTVFIMSGNNRYLPREEAIDYHSYEGDTRDYTREAGDLMVQNFNEILNEVNRTSVAAPRDQRGERRDRRDGNRGNFRGERRERTPREGGAK